MAYRAPYPSVNDTYHSNLNNKNIQPVANRTMVHNPNLRGFQGNTQNVSQHFNYMTSPPPNVNPSNLHSPNTVIRVGTLPNIGDTNRNDIPFTGPSTVNHSSNHFMNYPSQSKNTCVPYNQYHPPIERFPNISVNNNSTNSYPNSDQRIVPNRSFLPPVQNTPYNNAPSMINYQRLQNDPDVNAAGSSMAQPLLPQYTTGNENINNFAALPINYSNIQHANIDHSKPQNLNFLTPVPALPVFRNTTPVSTTMFCNVATPAPLQMVQNNAIGSLISRTECPLMCEKERNLNVFLKSFCDVKKQSNNQITVPEFRHVIIAVMQLMELLCEKKNKLSALLDSNENEWKLEMKNISQVQEEISTLCSVITTPDHLNSITNKLKLIRKRRERKKKTKQNKLIERAEAKKHSKELKREMYKWLEDLKEKNQKLKREAEMKKEADFILLEVRRKIQEANKTIEKIKMFEKLRITRQENALRKGLHIQPHHDEKFTKKISLLKETMTKQVADYIAEEKALKVMLETEQEGQEEEDAQWKIKKMKTLQQKKQKRIIECLFGNSDDVQPADPLYLFYKFHTASTSSIGNLVQIRHLWDTYIAEDGEAAPQNWIVPAAPSNPSWEQFLVTS